MPDLKQADREAIAEETIIFVREQMRDVRIWIGEITPEQEAYRPQHAEVTS